VLILIKGYQLRDSIISAANNIINNKKHIDDLNIFPVPDGDTGTNMSMTISSACEKLKEQKDDITVGEVAKITASNMLRSARGNSGVILSLLFRGFSKGLEGMSEVNGVALVSAFSIGVDAAYKAVMKPTEGTILTVARVGCESGTAACELDTDPVYVWSAVCKGASDALRETPELLPVLKKAGVVDAGGQGLCMILDGMLSVFKSDTIISPLESQKEIIGEESDDFFTMASNKYDKNVDLTYSVKLTISRSSTESTPEEFKNYLDSIGNCVVLDTDNQIIKCYAHTENPGLILQKALEYGTLQTVDISNIKAASISEQDKNEILKAEKAAEASKIEKEVLQKVEPTEELGFVSVAAGEGLKSLFLDIGSTHVVSGGQTMNPSTEDIVEAVLATPAKNVFVLPNNKNIIMAAEQAVALVTDRSVVVVPTRTIPQGLSAMLAFDPELSIDDNKAKMLEAASHVDTGLVTFAARDSEFGSHRIKEGDILGLTNGKMEFIERSPISACYKVTKALYTKHTSFITVIYGSDTSESDAQEAVNLIQNKVGPDIEVTLVNGGQPVYYYIISVE
jgi:DAK2 domain fusion protein YloV